MEKGSKKALMVFKALSDDNRILILEMLKQGELSTVTLLQKLLITQPTLSHHLKILCDAGLVIGRRNGRWTHYSLIPGGFNMASEYLVTLQSGLGMAN